MSSLREPVTIIVPTFNNFDQLKDMIISIAQYKLIYPIRFVIVNNGEPEMSKMPFFDHPDITMLTPKKNLGWEGGLKLGLTKCDTEFVMFANDDIYIPEFSKDWISRLLQPFHDKTIGAVGPCTNVAMGAQNIFNRREMQTSKAWYGVNFLIGFCMLLRREALEVAGGIDDTLPGGDDLDLSIRLQQAGYNLVLDASTFVWHHGFQTGTRVHGDHTKPNGWNSREMTERTNMALIKKHGLKTWHNLLHAQPDNNFDYTDYEGNQVREFIHGENVIEMGVGAKKTVDTAVGVDIIPKGEPVSSLQGAPPSVADLVCDITKELPIPESVYDTLIARHVLEHIQDPVEVLKEWVRVVKPGGRLIIVVPNQDDGSTIPMNPEHLHAYNPNSLTSLVELLGMKVLEVRTHYNLVSFMLVAEKL